MQPVSLAISHRFPNWSIFIHLDIYCIDSFYLHRNEQTVVVTAGSTLLWRKKYWTSGNVINKCLITCLTALNLLSNRPRHWDETRLQSNDFRLPWVVSQGSMGGWDKRPMILQQLDPKNHGKTMEKPVPFALRQCLVATGLRTASQQERHVAPLLI